MSKIYQEKVINEATEIVNVLTKSGFFNEYEIETTDFALSHLCDKLTEVFIKGDFADGVFFDEEEFETILQEIIAGSLLNQLKEKGFINSYEDDNTEETFFLTKDGVDLVKKIQSGEDLTDLLG